MKKLFLLGAMVCLSVLLNACTKTEENNTASNDTITNDNEEVVDGRLPGVFSISSTTRVRFSKGNLQYNASQNIWRFAERQYDYVGEGNRRIAVNYNGWIDFFGWGTSGWYSGANCYEPWSASTNNADYLVGGSSDYNLDGDYAWSDWGVFNTISNSKEGIEWRTLSEHEWTVLLSSDDSWEESLAVRANKAGLATLQIADSIFYGLVLLPDEWHSPEDISFSPGTFTASFDDNVYNANQWGKMENNGAVFFVASGYRYGGNINKEKEWGCYWTSTAVKGLLNSKYCAKELMIRYHHIGISTTGRSCGSSVRLVTEDL